MKPKKPLCAEQQTNHETINPAIRLKGGRPCGIVAAVEPSRDMFLLPPPATQRWEVIHLKEETNPPVDGRAGSSNDLRLGKRAEVNASPQSSMKTILIADDEINIRESLAVVLQEENFSVRLAENGREAVREFLAGPPDLIVLDLNMPDTDGWKAFDVIARLAPDMPVIVITARPGQARRAAEAGIDMLLEKPLDIRVLLETIRNLLVSPETSSFARVLRAWRSNDQVGYQS